MADRRRIVMMLSAISPSFLCALDQFNGALSTILMQQHRMLMLAHSEVIHELPTMI